MRIRTASVGIYYILIVLDLLALPKNEDFFPCRIGVTILYISITCMDEQTIGERAGPECGMQIASNNIE
jgi:hypothetical protein